ncbi:MAG TPA: hypothetical protein VMR77_00010 [Patescibacteria group bacterium]|jgi:hypothetical protein|nr:hypothetical protein [Patescibacteria group bacterium]
MIKELKIVLSICLFAYLLIFAFIAQQALAQTMSNAEYIIQMGNLNSISGKPTGSGFALSFTSGQTGNGLYSGTNFKVRAGFQYISSIIPFRFSITNTFIDFGIVSPTSPVLRTSLLTVSNGSAFGYQVTASQNHNLRANNYGNEIPPTACGDSGPSCDPNTAGPWTGILTYGFGYRCDNQSGTDCDTQFSDSTFYKPFAASPSAVAVMSGITVGRNKVSQITYKLNISGAQPAGLYTNVINYIATPTF